MQLFRQQALEHQNRLHGEVFLVPPLRWQAIGWLLFLAVALGVLSLTLGSHSQMVEARGVLHPPAPNAAPSGRDWTAKLAVPASQIAQIEVGQGVHISLLGYPTQDFGTLTGKVSAIARAPANSLNPHFEVTVALAQLTPHQQQSGLMLRSNWHVHGRILVRKQSILRWLIAPRPAGAAR